MSLKKTLSVFDRIGMPVLAGAAAVLFWMETRHALRKRRASRTQRLLTNAGIASVAAVGLRWALLPAMVAAARAAQTRTDALLPRWGLPAGPTWLLSFLLLDYGNYGWHCLLHRFPWLWRFHQVHHSDLDLDVATAWRFHVGEMLFSILFRGGVVRLLGPPPLAVVAYEIVYEGATAFHHSNWKLPATLEKQLNRLVVTPRMHGIHHSIVQSETDSNYSIVFSFWDRLHRTDRLEVPQEAVTIGTPAYRQPSELTLSRLFRMPFAPMRPWRLPDGSVPERPSGANPSQPNP
jgi:sterol desaturase/sphingolipid hydroxylase (fatty acid hydroxylase superfamily)